MSKLGLNAENGKLNIPDVISRLLAMKNGKDLPEFDRTSDLRKKAYKAASQIEMATYALLLTKLEITNGTGND